MKERKIWGQRTAKVEADSLKREEGRWKRRKRRKRVEENEMDEERLVQERRRDGEREGNVKQMRKQEVEERLKNS